MKNRTEFAKAELSNWKSKVKGPRTKGGLQPKPKPTPVQMEPHSKTAGNGGQFMSSDPNATSISSLTTNPIIGYPLHTNQSAIRGDSKMQQSQLVGGVGNWNFNYNTPLTYAQLQPQIGPLAQPLFSSSPFQGSFQGQFQGTLQGMDDASHGNSSLELVPLSLDTTQPLPQQTTIVTLASGQTLQLPLRPSAQQSALSAMRWDARDAPRFRLSTTQDSYLAAIVLAYSLLRGYAFPVSSTNKTTSTIASSTPTAVTSATVTATTAERLNNFIIQACQPYNVDEDSTSVVESGLETMVYYLQKRQPDNNVVPLIWIPPLFDQFLTAPLRLTVYGEMNAKYKQGPSVNDFTWKHTFERKLEDEKDVDEKTTALRTQYFNFLIRLYEFMWEAMMVRKLEKVGTQGNQYLLFLKKTFSDMNPHMMTTAILESKIKAIASRFQLIDHVFFNTYRFLKDARELNKVMDFAIAQFISSYLYLIR